MLNNPDYQNYNSVLELPAKQDRTKRWPPWGWNVRGFCEITASEWSTYRLGQFRPIINHIHASGYYFPDQRNKFQ